MLAKIPIFTALFFISLNIITTFIGVPNRNRTRIKGLGNPRSIQLNYGDATNTILFIDFNIASCIASRYNIR